MFLSVTAVLMLASCARGGENPGIQVTLTNKGLQYGKHATTDWIQNMLESITLPDISGKVDMGLSINIPYTLTNTRIESCDLPEPSADFYPDATGLKTSMSGLSVALGGQWMTKSFLLHSQGTFDMAVYDVDVISVVELGRDADGHLSVTSTSCNARVGKVDVQLQGGTGLVFRLFEKRFKDQIGKEIESRICPYVEELIAGMEHQLQAVNVSFNVDQFLGMNLSLTTSPAIDVSSLNLGLKGEFFSEKTGAEPPFKAQPFTMPKSQGFMLSVGLSEFTLNSASYGYFTAGALQALIVDSMIPPDFPLHLNTSLMGPYVPQLPKMFPGLLMELQVNARDTPMFSFRPDAVKLCVHNFAKAFAVQLNGTRTPLFQLNFDSTFSGKVWIAGGKVKGSVSIDNFTLTLAGSEVGTFVTKPLEDGVRKGIEMGLVKLNENLGRGIVIPRLKEAQLVNSVLKVQKGFIALLTDAEVLLTDRGFNQQT